MMAKKDEYISLREAAAMSGYSSDYVGQLIRSGKIPGKQVFANVAWMTTPEAIREYMEQKGRVLGEREPSLVSGVIEREINTPRIVKNLSIALIALCVMFLLLLFYVFSSALDQTLNQRALERVEQQQT
jgi:hypothetical protein